MPEFPSGPRPDRESRVRVRSPGDRVGRPGDLAGNRRQRDRRRHGEYGSRTDLINKGRWGYRMGDGELAESVFPDGLNDAFSDGTSGWHTEDLVREFQISR